MRHLTNFAVGDLLQYRSLFYQTRIRCHNAFDISINLDTFSMQSGAYCSSRSITAAAAQSSKLAVIFRHALKPADNRNNA